jgi:hypothetical protein
VRLYFQRIENKEVIENATNDETIRIQDNNTRIQEDKQTRRQQNNTKRRQQDNNTRQDKTRREQHK